MKFLSKIGQIIVKGLEIITGLEPMVAAINPSLAGPALTVSHDLEQVAAIIQQMEAIGQALGIKGPDKLRGAAPLVAQIILRSTVLVNHQISDGPLFTQGTTKIADGMADVLNSLKDNIQTTNKGA